MKTATPPCGGGNGLLIGTVVVAHERLALLQQTLESYAATTTGPYVLVVVDNASSEPVTAWLEASGHNVVYLHTNRYPGYAANLGWAVLIEECGADIELLHRSDSDMLYQPGWAAHVRGWFAADAYLGQLGLRTLAEEGQQGAVGGNMVLRRACWDAGIRYSGRPWSPDEPFEDGVLSHAVEAAGWRWARATQPCALHMGKPDPDDPYYVETWRVRGLGRPAVGTGGWQA